MQFSIVRKYNLYKLKNIFFFRKTYQDVRKYNCQLSGITIVNIENDIEKLSKKENLKTWHIQNEHLASVLMEKILVTLDKPRFMGSAILALPKTVMYDLH